MKYSTKLVSILKDEMNASEVIFKDDHALDTQHVNAGSTKFLKSDLRNADVLLKLLKDHYKTSELHDEEWKKIYDLLKNYVTQLTEAETPRNVKWSLRSLKFNNLFNYGENNSINFDNLSGLVGLFAPNRSGKSSLLGTLMYTFFNATDRGSLKNQVVCNTKKTDCSSRAVINISGKDYVIKRTTEKRSNKQGVEHAVTDLMIWEYEDKKLKEITGEQRNDTEKILKKLIGTADDFHLMTISTQSHGTSLLEQGSTKRRHVLSRFFDIDVLQQIHELAHDDVREFKSTIKNMVEFDWATLSRDKRNEISVINDTMESNGQFLEQSREELVALRSKLSAYDGFEPVSEAELKKQADLVGYFENKLQDDDAKHSKVEKNINETHEKIDRLKTILENNDLAAMKLAMDAFKTSESAVGKALQLYETELRSLERAKKSLKILDEVPCGDEYPTCKFIKDAHETRGTIDQQKTRLRELKEAYDQSRESLNSVDVNKLSLNIDKVEKLKERLHHFNLALSRLELDKERIINDRSMTVTKLNQAVDELARLTKMTDKKKRAEIDELNSKILSLDMEIAKTEKENLILATKKGKIESELEKLSADHEKRNDVLQKMKIHEVIETSFSKTGIQDVILLSLLPVINEQMAKILSGIINFTVELDKDPENDQIDIFINYGDGDRRLLELGSGMEKMISNIAIRTALNNVSTLPKCDMFIIDEGFGALDQQGIEECSVLLQSLKQYFKTVLIITHVDQIKESVDTLLEITKNGKDASIQFL